MSELSNKVLDLLLENNVDIEDITNILYDIQNDINLKLWEKFTISPYIYLKLKDTIFYNFEYLYYNDNPTGKTDMKYYGKKYPILMYGVSKSSYVLKENLNDLLKEIEDIKSKWNNNIYVANLSSKIDFDWIGGDENPTKMIIYDKEIETPMKYGYYSYMNNLYDKIYDAHGNFIKKNEEIVLCSIQKMDIYREYSILTHTLDNFYNVIKRAININKGILLDFKNYDYEK